MNIENWLDDAFVVDAVLQGDREAFGLLVRRYQKPIYNLMYRLSRSRMEAQDLTQEAFVKAFERLSGYKKEYKFINWLYTIGFNHARDWLRKSQRRRIFSEEIWADCLPEPKDQAAMLEDRVDLQQLDAAVKSLPFEFREALLLHYHAEVPVKDIAEILGIGVSGVKMRIHRALNRLRQVLAEDQEPTGGQHAEKS